MCKSKGGICGIFHVEDKGPVKKKKKKIIFWIQTIQWEVEQKWGYPSRESPVRGWVKYKGAVGQRWEDCRIMGWVLTSRNAD